MKRNFLTILIFSSLSIAGIAQNTPSFRQFYFNPVTFNPAYVGASGQTELYVAMRKQWLGFKDAPTYTGINFLYPTNGRVSFALNVYEQEVVALRNSSAMATFAYRVPIAENQSLFFGLSGGLGFNNLDMGGVDYSNDPTIMNASVNTTYADGNFGVLYERGGLRLGFALPKLFGQKYFAPSQLDNIAFSQLKNQNYSLSYKFQTPTLSIEPWVLFRMSRDNANSWDAGANVTYKEVFWLGGAYSDAHGIAAFLGMDVKGRLRVGYSYEIPAAGFTQTSSHELQLRLRFGKKRDLKLITKSDTPAKNDSVTSFVYQPKQEEKIQLPKPQPKDTAKTVVTKVPEFERKDVTQPQLKEPIKQASPGLPTEIKPTPSSGSGEIKKLVDGFYIVTGSFKSADNARTLAKNLRTKGFSKAEVAFNEDTALYLVYVFYSTSKEDASFALLKFQEAGLKTYYLKRVP